MCKVTCKYVKVDLTQYMWAHAEAGLTGYMYIVCCVMHVYVHVTNLRSFSDFIQNTLAG